jgi:hypothetical protein
MPFFLHMDLLSEYRRVNYAFENYAFYPGFNRLVTFYIECFFYAFTQWFMVAKDVLLYLPVSEHSSASTTHHFIFSGDPFVFRHLFIFKLPYLVFDLLTAGLIWKYFAGHRHQTLALTLWLFNPVTIYATYIFGRFEVISLFFLVLTALCLKDKRLLSASVAFGLALNCREINFIYIPAFLIALYFFWINGSPSKIRLVLATVILLVLFRLPALIEWLFSADAAFTKESGPLEVSKGISAFFAGKLGDVYPFFLITALSYLIAFASKTKAEHQVFVSVCTATILAFFISGFNSAHYFAWAVPFLLLAIRQSPRSVFAVCLLMLGWLAFGLLNPEGAHFTPLLATPFHESFFGASGLLSNYQSIFGNHPFLDAKVVKGVILSVTTACMLTILYLVHSDHEL